MLFRHLYDIPSLEAVFGDTPKILHTLQRARFQSIVPVMMLPQRVLRDSVNGIGTATAHEISRILAMKGLDHRGFSESIRPFIARMFGDILNAPVVALQVVHVDAYICTLPMYGDLPLLHFMDEMTPHRTVRELMDMTKCDVRTEAYNLKAPAAVLDRLDRDITALNNRLHWWDDEYRLGVGELHEPVHLRVVGS